MENHPVNRKSRGKVTPSARKSHPKIMKSCTKVAEIATQRSDSSKTNEIPMVLHVSRTGKSSKDMASDWEVSWQASQNHYKIGKTIQEFEIPRQSYSRRMQNQPEIGKRFTRVTEIATRRSDSSKTNGIPMVLHVSQDREVAQRRGIRS